MEKSENLISKMQKRASKSITLKLFTITLLSLMLLIPQSRINRLIAERQERLVEAENEVAEKWSKQQKLVGPYLSVSYNNEKIVMVEGKETIHTEKRKVFLFPEQLQIEGEVHGVPLKRGIFDIVVYRSELQLSGLFVWDAFQKLGIAGGDILTNEIKMHIAFSDMRGLGEDPYMLLNGKSIQTEPYFDQVNNLVGLQLEVPVDLLLDTLQYSCNLQLKGSRSLFFAPVGKTTQVHLSGDWKDPSFQGNFLPYDRDISFYGFSSSWQVLHFNRTFPQEFMDKMPWLETSFFGLSLLMPVDQYQKATRSTKYALLVIALSFLSLFLMELITNNKVHPIQYVLVGLALVLYYTLLISISEFIGFGYAYLIASTATVALLTLYARTFISQNKRVGLFSVLLIVFYTFIYVITEQQERALLIGSIGLFMALAATMFVSRKIQWYSETDKP